MSDFFERLRVAEKLEQDKGHKENLERLAPGDVIFHAGTLNHAYMYMGTVYGKAHCRVHARSGVKPHGVYIDLMPAKTSIWFASTIFRCKDKFLVAEACNFALAWACKDPESFKVDETREKEQKKKKVEVKKPTGFSMERFDALVDSSKSADPFTAASLKRAFKYASRREAVLSNKKGTTCTAFLIACYQAACLWIGSKGNTEGLGKAYVALGKILAEDSGIDVEDAWAAVAHLIGVKKTKAKDFFPAFIWLESKTANAGRPWKERIEADSTSWGPVTVKEIY